MSPYHHVRPFVNATTDVLKLQTGMDFKRDEVNVDAFAEASPEVNMIIGMTGKLNGSVSLGMSLETATHIAAAMVKSDLLDKKAVETILTALGSAITSEASIELKEMGFECSSLFPTLVLGEDITVSTPIRQKHSISFSSRCGSIQLKASLLERKTL